MIVVFLIKYPEYFAILSAIPLQRRSQLKMLKMTLQKCLLMQRELNFETDFKIANKCSILDDFFNTQMK